jgi:hypothetical protein
VAVARHDHFAVRQLRALRERLVEADRRVDTLQPVVQQRLQPGVLQPEQIVQARQGAVRVVDRRRRRRIERQPRRRRIGRERPHRVQATDRQRRQPLAQRRLERRLPARLDVDLPPQPRQPVESVPRQPRLQLALGLHLLLQCAQCVQPGGQLGQRPPLARDHRRRMAPLGVDPFHLRLQVVPARVRHPVRLVVGARARFQRGQPLAFGRLQSALLGVQSVTPRLQLAVLLVDAARLGRQHLDLLLHLCHLPALLARARLRRAQRVLRRGQLRGVRLDLRGQGVGLRLRLERLRAGPLEFLDRGAPSALPLGLLRLQLGQPLLQPLAGVDDVADALLEPAHLERGVGEFALPLVQRVAGAVVRLADRLQLGLDVPQRGQLRVERRLGLAHRLRRPGLLAGGVAVFQEPQLVLAARRLVLQRPILLRDLGLAFELAEVGVELTQDVLDPGQVLARVLEPVLGLAPALLVFRDTGRLLEEQPQLLGAALDDAADRALPDDRVGARAEAGPEEHVLHVPPSHRLVVDVVAAGAVARQHPLDRDLAERVPLSAGTGVGVVEHELDARPTGRLALARAIEDHVLHGLAAQLARLALAEHPAHGVHDVGLAAAVRADDADALAGKLEGGGLGERLEAGQLDLVQTHRAEAEFTLKTAIKYLMCKQKSAPRRSACRAG